jgi:small GTP-binding protein
MPVNAGPEYFAAEKKYLQAKSKEEKINALEEMIRALPKHKGSEHLLSQLKHRLKKLKEEKTTKASAKPKFSIKREGAAQICIIGLTKSGKSSLLKALTAANVEITDYPYATKHPVVGMMNYGDVQIQLIEIPSTFDPDFMSILQTCDLILILIDSSQDVDKQTDELTKILGERFEDKKTLFAFNKSDVKKFDQYLSISAKEKIGLERLKEEIWNRLDLIRVYTKSLGKPKVIPPVTLPKDATVKDVAKAIHKDFLKNFSFARVFDSTPFSGQKVGLDFKLKDLDVVEIHTK